MMKPKSSLLPLFALLATLWSGCGMVDSEPVSVIEHDATRYFFKLDTLGLFYKYNVEHLQPATAPYSLEMGMYGKVANEKYSGKQIYTCDWITSSYEYYYYYAMDRDTVHSLGATKTPKWSWIELASPIRIGQTWSFPYGANGGVVNAEITRTGFSAMLSDANKRSLPYHDLIEVVYHISNDSGSAEKQIKWFQRDNGMVYEAKFDRKNERISQSTLVHVWYE